MRTVFMLLAVMMPLAAVDKPAAQKPAAPAAKAAPKAVEIPAGAVETEVGTFSFTDPQGKKWIYRKTPFGVVRTDDNKGDAAAPEAKTPAAAPDNVKVSVVDKGDTVHFERPGPFGLFKWDRKKSELTDEERGWLERSRTATPQGGKQN